MQPLNPDQMAEISGGDSENCGGTWSTLLIIQTCNVAGGLIGLAGGPIGSGIGSFIGASACHYMCYHAGS